MTDAGIQYLALPKHAALHCRLARLAVNHTGATEASVCGLLERCRGLESLSIRGLLFNADSTMECIARNCRCGWGLSLDGHGNGVAGRKLGLG